MEGPTGPFDGYPPDYIAHNLPLIVLSGLCPSPLHNDGSLLPEVYEGSGTEISSESPIIEGERAETLLQEFYHCSKTDEQWNSKPVQGRSGLLGFRFRAVGRDFTLPPRKAEPPSELHSVDAPSSPSTKGPTQWLLHSPISPLSPSSPIFPDGVMTPMWIAKHQHFVPSTFISFFTFSSDPARNSLLDNQLKNEINNVKAALYRSEYKTRYVVVLLSDKTILEAPDIEDRLANIRRATSLDAKNGFFFLPPNTSRVEVASFVESLLSTLQPLCVEYYRDLTKHTRRKKNRGTIPPPTAPPTRGTSQTLAALGWGVRYDFKLGTFAEFRQEMEAACRHYTSALESLIGPDGIFETTASWSPRWDEARLLADTLAFRVIRCLLWSNLTTTAAQSWSNYKDRMRELVDRRGKGSSNYGWEAWESRWAKVMAELIRRAELQPFQIPESIDDSEVLNSYEFKVWAPVEKAFPVGERLSPWHHLQHPGYWWRQAARHTKLRRHLALQLPEEDRVPPGMSPASAMASRYGTYDTYLCPEPHAEFPIPGKSGYDHSKDILLSLDTAIEQFTTRAQRRLAEEVLLEKGKELMQTGQSMPALQVLHSLWEQMSWRRERWWRLVYEVNQNLCRCAKLVGNVELFAATQFELYSSSLPYARNFQYDFTGAVNSVQRQHTLPEHELEAGPAINLVASQITSFLTPSLSFFAVEGNAGEPVKTQLRITSGAHKGSTPVTMSHVVVQFEGGANKIEIAHKGKDSEVVAHKSRLVDLALSENVTLKSGPPSYTAEADLTICPGQTIALDFSLVIREAGSVAVTLTTISMNTNRSSLNYTCTPEDNEEEALWWIQGPTNPRTRRLGRQECHKIQILPRPPKMELQLPSAEQQFYTDEPITLDIEVVNGEDEETEATLEVRVLTHDGAIDFSWLSAGNTESTPTIAENAEAGLPGHRIGVLTVNERKSESISFMASSEPTEYIVEVKVLYHLFSDKETPVSRTHSSTLNIVRAFEANYDFVPRVHEDPWPTLFDVSSLPPPPAGEGEMKKGNGIIQRWHLSSRLASFATEALFIKNIELEVESLTGGSTVTTVKEDADEKETAIQPSTQKPTAFILDIQKSSLEDRRSTTLDLNLRITWQRLNSKDSGLMTSTLPIPPLTIPNAEPRVLCTRTVTPTVTSEAPVDITTLSQANVLTLTYTIENPTTHFLTFDIAMESTDDFAFSGPKLRSMNVLPMSRDTVAYRILPLVDVGEDDIKGMWIDVKCRIVDRYFKKVLRVLAASEGVRDGKGGGVGVWVGSGLGGV